MKKDTEYTPHLVAYVDILGFRNMVKAAEDDPSSIHRIWNVLREARSHVEAMNTVQSRGISDSESLDLHAEMFSDTVVMTQPTSDGLSAAALLEWVSVLQGKLLEEGTFVRGAVAAGGMFIKGDLMFGPGIVTAYDAEQLAVWPRVVVDPSVLEEEAATLWLQHFGSRDCDGLLYIDYLKSELVTEIALEVEFALRYGQTAGQHITEPIARRYFGKHAEGIVRSLCALDWDRDAKTIQKYHWLATYHNSTIDNLGQAVTGEGIWHSRFLDSIAWDLARGSKPCTPSPHVVDDELRRTYESVRDLRLDLRACFPSLY